MNQTEQSGGSFSGIDDEEQTIPTITTHNRHGSGVTRPNNDPVIDYINLATSWIKGISSVHALLCVLYFTLIFWSIWWILGLLFIVPMLGFTAAVHQMKSLMVTYSSITVAHLMLVISVMVQSFRECAQTYTISFVFENALPMNESDCGKGDIVAHIFSMLSILGMIILLFFTVMLHSLVVKRDKEHKVSLLRVPSPARI